MRKLKTLWRNVLTLGVCEELEIWISVLLGLGAALLLYATVKAQAAGAAELPSEVAAPTLLFQAPSGLYAGEPLIVAASQSLSTSMPAGAQWQAAFPKTATPSPLLRWLGAIASTVAGSLLVATHLPRRVS